MLASGPRGRSCVEDAAHARHAALVIGYGERGALCTQTRARGPSGVPTPRAPHALVLRVAHPTPLTARPSPGRGCPADARSDFRHAFHSQPARAFVFICLTVTVIFTESLWSVCPTNGVFLQPVSEYLIFKEKINPIASTAKYMRALVLKK